LVYVNFKPIIYVKKSSVGTGSNQTVNLTCIVRSYPKANILWYKENSNSALNSSDKVLNRTFVESTLAITSVDTNKDLGLYYCSASNMLGNTSTRIKLFGSTPNNSAIVSHNQTSINDYDFMVHTKSNSPILEFKLKFNCHNTSYWLQSVNSVNDSMMKINGSIYIKSSALMLCCNIIVNTKLKSLPVINLM